MNRLEVYEKFVSQVTNSAFPGWANKANGQLFSTYYVDHNNTVFFQFSDEQSLVWIFDQKGKNHFMILDWENPDVVKNTREFLKKHQNTDRQDTP